MALNRKQKQIEKIRKLLTTFNRVTKYKYATVIINIDKELAGIKFDLFN